MLKSGNFLHKQGLDDCQLHTTVVSFCQGSVASFEIQVTGTAEFEDGLKCRHQSRAKKSLHRVCTTNEINATTDARGGINVHLLL